ncbi:ParA family protein [Geomonas subterranea]|uniref:ParA family protein n=1 Tax=Geomonas subterranea TaxID=2847989 RepID=UPI001CD55784|nr:ParA family protein [Geomonas fuzhouensis]
MRKIAFINEKGGVGKTTSTVNVGGAIAESGKKVLMVDIDKQCYLTRFTGLRSGIDYAEDKTVNELLHGTVTAQDVIVQRSKNLWVIPSSTALAESEYGLFLKLGRERLLANALADVGKFDYILLDCPPSLGLMTVNALAYANEVVVVMQPEPSSLQGFDHLLKTFAAIKGAINADIDVTGVVCSMIERKKVHGTIFDHLKANLGDKMFKTTIPSRAAFIEASGQGKTIGEYKPSSDEAKLVRQLAAEVMKRKPK